MFQIIDRDGRPRWLQDHEIVPDGAKLARSLMLMDGRNVSFRNDTLAAPPDGAYFTRDGCGCINGVGSIDLAEKAAAARADYAQRLTNAHKRLVPLRDGYQHGAEKGINTMDTLGDVRAVAYAAYKRRLAGAHIHHVW